MAESEVVMPDGFPAGLRVFAVGDDSVVLRSLELMLVKCGYKVTTSNHALQALELLRANKAEFDIVITDINMPEMDGFKLLEIVAIEMNLPVIMLSVDSDFKSVMKGIKYGAVDYLIKPVRFEELRLIWKHVIKRSLSEKKDLNESKFDVRVSQHTKKPKDRVRAVEDDNFDSEDDSTSRKRARVNWTPELHTKFINAINQLGIDRAVPKKILDLMEIPGLSRENVASHLQKYRKGLKRNTIEFSQQVLGLAATRGYSGSSLPITFNRSRANLYKNKSVYSSYLPDQQFRNNHALDSRSWFPSMRHHNTFCSQYMANSLGNQLGTQQLGLTTNSCLMNMSTQLSGYQSLNTSSNWLNCQAERSQNPWISDGYAKPNSVSQLGGIMDQQVTETFSNNNFNDNGNSNEFATLFTFEEEQRQINSGSIADAEMERQVNIGSIDVQSFNFEDHRESNDSDLTAFSEEHLSAETIEKVLEFDNFDYTDDLHIVLREFQQENL